MFSVQAREKEMGRLVLVVEDDKPIQHLLVDVLEEAAYSVQTERLGKEAVAKAKVLSPDLILLDLMLPDMDGNGVLALLSNDAKLRKIPVIVLSAYPQLLKESPQVQAVISKPFDITELLGEVEEHISEEPGRFPHSFRGGSIQSDSGFLWTD